MVDWMVVTCLSNLSMNFVDEKAKSSDVDIQCASQNEEDNGGDTQVDSDGDEDGGKDSRRHHHLRSVLWSVVRLEVLCITAKIKEGVCCIGWEGENYMLR